jgi:CheY-like chemotaxis protein
MIHNRIRVLYTEDNPDDAWLFQRAAGGMDFDLVIVDSGEKCLQYLNEHPAESDLARPDLVVLDYFLPGRNGWQVADEIKSTPAWAQLPVVLFTSAISPDDYIQIPDYPRLLKIDKPSGLIGFEDVVRKIKSFYRTF